MDKRIERAKQQWQRIQRTKRALPYLLYTIGPSKVPCHPQWDGVLLPVDDPWWEAHFPPNSDECKCGVRQISKYEYQKLMASGSVKTKV